MTEALLPVFCLLGPTASGKTAASIELVERYPMEIVSVDSAQVYRLLNIGSAKPDAAELARAPHALIDVVDPWAAYSVAQFLDDVVVEIKRIHTTGKIPLLAGGTMLYFSSLWRGMSDLPTSEPSVRNRLQNFADDHGQQALYEKLQYVDPESAERIHANDPQRIMRALEVFEITGQPLSQLQSRRNPVKEYDFYNLGLFPEDRAMLHARIEQRFGLMLEAGFEAEVESLMNLPQMHSELPSMRCVGYRQMWQHLSGECDRKVMTDRAVAATRQLAKRQITWLRSMDGCRMLDPFDESVDLQDDKLASWLTAGLAKLSAGL